MVGHYRTPTERNDPIMMKHSIQSLAGLLVAVATFTLAGCQLYFGEEENNGTWNYCGSDGYYECTDDDCYWRSPECPASGGGWGSGSGSGQTPPGYECNDDSDCAAGCYCGNGVCEEAGFCATDADCGTGFVCDEARSSCEPEEEQPAVPCLWDSECATGEYCDPSTLECTASCTCATDADATAQGYGFCDESRGTCLPGADPEGDCAGAVTCNLGRPTCPAGEVALIWDGCYTGECKAIDTCASAPACEAFGHEADCRDGDNCSVAYTGINCKKADNSPCQAGDANCTCESYQFASCSSSGSSPRTTTVEFNGFTFSTSELTLRN